MSADPTHPTYYRDAAELRRWLAAHHAREREWWIGFHHKGSGVPSVSYPEALAEAICQGWIDGVRKRCGPRRYMIRFTPRRAGSIWSRVNVALAEDLIARRRMRAAGRRAFAARDPARTAVYGYEQPAGELAAAYERKFRARKRAWAHWESLPPSHRRRAAHWVMSAKKEETRRSRLDRLIASCAAGERTF